MMRFKTRWLLRPWFMAAVGCLLYCLAVIAANGGDPLALVTLGTRFSAGIVNGSEGYDGQFVYYIARDAASAPALIANGGDFPAYRFQRILLPVLGGWLSFGQVDWIPWALLAVNLVALAAGTALLEALLIQAGVSRWYAVGYAFSLAIFGSVRLSLPEPLAYGLVIAGVYLVGRERWLWGAAVFALAALTKETALVFVGGYGVYLLLARRWRLMLAFGLIAVLPFIALQVWLYQRFGSFGIGSGGALATGFEIIPFNGVLRILTEPLAVDFRFAVLPFGSYLLIPTEQVFAPVRIVIFGIFLLLLGPFVLLPTVWGLWQVVKQFRARRTHPLVALLAINALVMLFVPFSTYREWLGILRFTAGLQIALILYAAHFKTRRALRYSTLWFMTMILLVASDFSG